MKVIPLQELPKERNEIISCLKAGGLIVFPSDTVYGFLTDATSAEGVSKLIACKNRPPGKPISVFCANVEMIKSICNIKEKDEKMIEKLLPGPYTVILDSKHKVDKRLESETGTMGVRITQFEKVQEFVADYGSPLTATSANLSGDNPHYSLESLLKSLPQDKQDLIDYVIDSGTLPRNKPSTVIDLTTPQLTVLRTGDLVLEEQQVVNTKSEDETREFAKQFIQKVSSSQKGKPSVFILKGEVGAGKTIFTKGVGDALGIDDIISPTFVIYYEYSISDKAKNAYNNLYHFDLYNIASAVEFEHLGILELVKEKNILVIEWGEKLGDLYKELAKKAQVILIELNHVAEQERKLTIFFDNEHSRN